MAEGLKQKSCESLLSNGEEDYDDCELFNSTSISDDSMPSTEEDDEVSFSSFSSNSLVEPLYEFPSPMADLPIKRGLSKFFHGKSQTFTSLSQVKCIEDLAKKERPYSVRKMKSYRRIEKSYYAPNHSSKIISKNAPRNSCASLLERSRSSSLFYNNKDFPITVQKNCIYFYIKEEEDE